MKSSSYFQQITMLFDLFFLLFVTALNPIGLNEIRHEPIGDLRNASLIKVNEELLHLSQVKQSNFIAFCLDVYLLCIRI